MMIRPLTDSQLLEGLRGRSEQAFAFLYKHMLPEVKNYIKRNSGDDDDAKDIFQDTIIALLRNLDENRYNHQNFKGYFMTIVRYKWLDRIDKGAAAPRPAILPELAHEDAPVEVGTAPRLSDYLRGALRRLGEPCRSLILGTVVFKKNMEDMAQRLGYASAHSARQQKLQCLKKLRLLVDPRVIAGLS